LFIDIHTHILPGLDDGAQTIDDSLQMAQVAFNDGTTILVATPHVRTGTFDNRKDDILIAAADLNKELTAKGINLLVLPGAEYSLEPNLAKRLADGELLTINNMGRHLMIELPSLLIPDNTENILYEIQLQGVTPIIAHPERNYALSRNPGLLQSYVKRGILAQVTSTSITGWFGREVRKTALKFIGLGLVQCVASDGHAATGRAPVLAQAYKEIRHKWGQTCAQALAYDNPCRIINGETVETGSLPRKQTIWNRLRGTLEGDWSEQKENKLYSLD
jgi:protein-tyrosine phosphatase